MILDEHIENVVRRARAFYEAPGPGHFLVSADVPAEAPALPPLCDFDLDRQLTEWLDCLLEAARPGWAAKEGLDDDSLPCLSPYFGYAEHSAWIGLDARLQESTSLAVPIVHGPDDIVKLTLSEEHKWFQYMKRGYDYLRSRKDGTFLLCMRGSTSPMDLANSVRGDELFTDFVLQPEFAHRLSEVMTEAIDWYYRHQLSWADDIDGGRIFSMGGGWMPGTTIGHMTNDAAMLCGPDLYAKFGFPYERRIVERYDHVQYHVHNEKVHHLPQLAALPNLAMLEVSDDPGSKPVIEDLPRILESTGSANLMLRNVSSDQLREHIDELKCRNVFFQVACHDRSDAEDMVTFVRGRSRHSS